MTASVKGGSRPAPRPDQARTRLARRSVVAAARSLFVARGYAATSIEAISTQSGIPQATVYRLFGSKVGILKSLLDTSIAGDDRPVAVPERPVVAALFAEPDPARLLAGFARFTASINERTHDVYRVLLSAADADAAAAELLRDVQGQRLRGQREIARTLARRGSLRAGLPERDAVDIVHALMSPEVFRLLVVDRRWSVSRYRRWLGDTLVHQLT